MQLLSLCRAEITEAPENGWAELFSAFPALNRPDPWSLVSRPGTQDYTDTQQDWEKKDDISGRLLQAEEDSFNFKSIR